MREIIQLIVITSVLPLAYAGDDATATGSTLNPRIQSGYLSSASRDRMNVLTTFTFPAGETNFVFHDGQFLFEIPVAEAASVAPLPDSCVITRPYVPVDGQRVAATELTAGGVIPVGDARVWIDVESQLIGAYIRFYNDGFQITCYGTRGHAPTIGDLSRHFGRVFEFTRN